MKTFFLFIHVALLVLATPNISCAISSSEVTYGGYLDTYYAYDFNSPKDHERQYTTQPVRHNEFNVNLAYFEANIRQKKTRGRLALQYGQSVTKNTVFEPHQGTTSGPQDAKIFQEAYIGTKLGEKTWLDAGIFLGNIGAESWISKDNWTYTRSLNLDYVPYYSSGIRIEHQIDQKQSLQFQIFNGWQNMSENDQSKAFGVQYKNMLSEKMTFTYNNFFGDEKIAGTQPRFRGYHNFILKWLVSEKWQYLYAFDWGHQAQQQNTGLDSWLATTLTMRRVLKTDQAVALRVEYYNDRHQLNVITHTPNGFQILGASMNIDQNLDETTLWRTELRGFSSVDKIYPRGSHFQNKLDGFIVSSLSKWF